MDLKDPLHPLNPLNPLRKKDDKFVREWDVKYSQEQAKRDALTGRMSNRVSVPDRTAYDEEYTDWQSIFDKKSS